MFCNCFFEKKEERFFDGSSKIKKISREREGKACSGSFLCGLSKIMCQFSPQSLCVEILPRAFHPFSSSLLLLLLSDLYYYY